MIQKSGTVTNMRKAWAMTSEAVGSDLKLMKGLFASMADLGVKSRPYGDPGMTSPVCREIGLFSYHKGVLIYKCFRNTGFFNCPS